MMAIQKSNMFSCYSPFIPREEYLYLTLGPHITNENIQIVYNVMYAAMLQSVSLLKEYDVPSSVLLSSQLFSIIFLHDLSHFSSLRCVFLR